MLLARLVAAALVAGAECTVRLSSGPVSPTTQGGGTGPTANVEVGDNFFRPANDTIAVGGTVRWTWTGMRSHSVTFDPPDSRSSPVQAVGTYTLAFPTAGTFRYFCSVHGRLVMAGTVVVR